MDWFLYDNGLRLERVKLISCHCCRSVRSENIRKPEAIGCFDGVKKETSGLKCIKNWNKGKVLLTKNLLNVVSKILLVLESDL